MGIKDKTWIRKGPTSWFQLSISCRRIRVDFAINNLKAFYFLEIRDSKSNTTRGTHTQMYRLKPSLHRPLQPPQVIPCLSL